MADLRSVGTLTVAGASIGTAGGPVGVALGAVVGAIVGAFINAPDFTVPAASTTANTGDTATARDETVEDAVTGNAAASSATIDGLERRLPGDTEAYNAVSREQAQRRDAIDTSAAQIGVRPPDYGFVPVSDAAQLSRLAPALINLSTRKTPGLNSSWTPTVRVPPASSDFSGVRVRR